MEGTTRIKVVLKGGGGSPSCPHARCMVLPKMLFERDQQEVPYFGLPASLCGASPAAPEAKRPGMLGYQTKATSVAGSILLHSFQAPIWGSHFPSPQHEQLVAHPPELSTSCPQKFSPPCLPFQLDFFFCLPLHLSKQEQRQVQSELLLLAGCLCSAPLLPIP